MFYCAQDVTADSDYTLTTGSTTLATATAQTGTSRASFGGIGGGQNGMTPPDGAAGDGQSDASADGETTQRRGRGDFAAQQAEKTDGNALTKAVSAVKAWLYEGVNTDSQPVSGTLVKVETGMQNDDYVEILSGVSEGDVVLYTASSTSTSSSMMMGMSMMSMGGRSGGSRGGNGGMGGGPGGF